MTNVPYSLSVNPGGWVPRVFAAVVVSCSPVNFLRALVCSDERRDDAGGCAEFISVKVSGCGNRDYFSTAGIFDR